MVFIILKGFDGNEHHVLRSPLLGPTDSDKITKKINFQNILILELIDL